LILAGCVSLQYALAHHEQEFKRPAPDRDLKS
jgi:hypothetical protein